MKLRHLIFGIGAASAGLLVYGALVEANRLVLERRRLRLGGWPKRLNGYKIAVLADLHIRDGHSAQLAKRAVDMALAEIPDMVLLPGDIVGYWKPEIPKLVGEALEALLLMEGSVAACPGNREYWAGSPALLVPVLDELNIKFLRNGCWAHHGIQWIGVDSVNAEMDDPQTAMRGLDPELPSIVLWHEPDHVDRLPSGAALMVSGHTHGGQFRTPWGWPPMTTENGRKYLEGFFPDALTPLYVSRGVGTTGPPSRLFCPPEVSLLILESEELAQSDSLR